MGHLARKGRQREKFSDHSFSCNMSLFDYWVACSFFLDFVDIYVLVCKGLALVQSEINQQNDFLSEKLTYLNHGFTYHSFDR